MAGIVQEPGQKGAEGGGGSQRRHPRPVVVAGRWTRGRRRHRGPGPSLSHDAIDVVVRAQDRWRHRVIRSHRVLETEHMAHLVGTKELLVSHLDETGRPPVDECGAGIGIQIPRRNDHHDALETVERPSFRQGLPDRLTRDLVAQVSPRRGRSRQVVQLPPREDFAPFKIE